MLRQAQHDILLMYYNKKILIVCLMRIYTFI